MRIATVQSYYYERISRLEGSLLETKPDTFISLGGVAYNEDSLADYFEFQAWLKSQGIESIEMFNYSDYFRFSNICVPLLNAFREMSVIDQDLNNIHSYLNRLHSYLSHTMEKKSDEKCGERAMGPYSPEFWNKYEKRIEMMFERMGQLRQSGFSVDMTVVCNEKEIVVHIVPGRLSECPISMLPRELYPLDLLFPVKTEYSREFKAMQSLGILWEISCNHVYVHTIRMEEGEIKIEDTKKQAEPIILSPYETTIISTGIGTDYYSLIDIPEKGKKKPTLRRIDIPGGEDTK